MEPHRLKYGKAFHEQVQENFELFSEGKPVREVSIDLIHKRNSRKGRMDIFITEMDDNVAILEIKGTDWDRIKPRNIKRNLYNHQRQLFKYIDAYMEENQGMDVTHGVIYPQPPETPGLRVFIEEYMMNKYFVPIYFYSEIESKE